MDTQPYGFCQCGCRQKTTIADRNHAQYGYVKGEPRRFIVGHNMPKGRRLSAETRARIRAANLGKTIPPETRAKMSLAQRGEKGSMWRGGRYLRRGRWLVLVGRDHPMADAYGYVYEHRLVVANALGRPLAGYESVHHIDLNPQNNSPENLALMSRGAHTRLHNLIRDQKFTPKEALATVMGW